MPGRRSHRTNIQFIEYFMADNEKNLKNQVIALAGIAQAAALVDMLARTGQDEAESFNTLMHALLETNPKSAESVYIDRNHLRLGLDTLRRILHQNGGAYNNQENYNYGEILRYVLSMLHLERKLSSNKEMLGIIGKRLEHVKRQLEHVSGADIAYRNDNVLANTASIYTDTISTFRFRIQVNGNPIHLQQELIIHKIRCLLLCGIRSAVLWKQMGGNRFKVLLNRKQHAEMASELLRLH
jgi:high frequency lysogenization protein